MCSCSSFFLLHLWEVIAYPVICPVQYFRCIFLCMWNIRFVTTREGGDEEAVATYFFACATTHLVVHDFRYFRVNAGTQYAFFKGLQGDSVFIHNRNLCYTMFSNICKCCWSVFYPVLVERIMALAVMTLSKLNNEFQCLFLYIFSKLLLNTCQREYFSHFCCFTAVRV